MIINSQRLADHVFGRSKTLLPAAVTDHRDWMRVRSLIFFRKEIASEKRLHPEGVEIISRDQVSPNALVSVFVAEAHRREPIRHQAREDIVPIAIVLVI